MSDSHSDPNLLFGILAVQMDFISREELMGAMNDWVMRKHQSLGDILREQGALDEEHQALLDKMVAAHLKKHENDVEKSLCAVSSIHSLRHQLETITDPDVRASLALVAATCAEDSPLLTDDRPTGESTWVGSRFRVLPQNSKKGGMGEVFEAMDEELHRKVALKQIQERFADQVNSRARFVREAEITGRLEHPGIVPVYSLGNESNGRPYYAMRYILGDNLRVAISHFHAAETTGRDPGDRGLELRKLLDRFIDVCNAIEYAHSRGILHRDLKPDNIMLGKYGETLVIDWGLAKYTDQAELSQDLSEAPLRPASEKDSAATQMGSTIGTPAYMSPEQTAGRLDLLGPASDIYSLGATLYELLTNQAAFQGASVDEVRTKVLAGTFDPPRQVKKQTPAPLDAICLKAMSLKREDRYASAQKLADDIEHWLADEPVTAQAETFFQQLRRIGRRHRTWMIAGSTALIVVATVSLVAVMLIIQQRKVAEIESKAEETASNLLNVSVETISSIFDEAASEELRDIPQLVKLREKLIKYCREFFTPEKQSYLAERREYDEQLEKFGDKLKLFDPKMGKDMYQESIKYLEYLQENNKSIQPELISKSHIRLAEVRTDLGEQGARQELEETAKRLQGLVDENPDNAKYQFLLGECYHALGYHFQALGGRTDPDNKEALGHYKDSQECFTRIVNELSKRVANAGPHDVKSQDDVDYAKYRQALARSYSYQGNLYLEMVDLEKAKAAYDESFNIRKELSEEDPTDAYRRFELARSYQNSGRLEAASKPKEELDEAITFYQQALELQTQLHEEKPLVVKYKTDLAYSCLSLAELYCDKGAPDSAKRVIQVAEEASKGLPESIDGLEVQSGIALATARVNALKGEQSPEVLDEADAKLNQLINLSNGEKADVELKQDQINDPRMVYNKAVIAALRAAAATSAPDQAKQKAVGRIREAIRKGYRDHHRFRRDHAFNNLPERDELIQEMEEEPKPSASDVPPP